MDFQWKREWTAPVVVGVVSFGVGAATGYTVHLRKAKKDIQELIDLIETVEVDVNQLSLELDNRNETIGRLMGVENPSKPFLITEEDIARLSSKSNHPATQVVGEELAERILESELHDSDEPEPTSIFQTTDEESNWDYEVENRARELAPDKPYVIHRDEYDTEELGWGNSTLTYYQGDDVLVDEHDVPIYNAKEYVPMPIEFGKGSGDPSIVYIRNPKLEAEYEIILDHGHYAVEVLGAEMEHSFDSRKPPLHKFRSDD